MWCPGQIVEQVYGVGERLPSPQCGQCGDRRCIGQVAWPARQVKEHQLHVLYLPGQKRALPSRSSSML
jgi:hypothetical protein